MQPSNVHPETMRKTQAANAERAKFVSVYRQLRNACCKIENHESDLYVEATPIAHGIVKASGWNYSFFKDAIDGTTWLEVPFGYEPFWAGR